LLTSQIKKVKYYKININDFNKEYSSLDTHSIGTSILADKSKLNFIKIENLFVGGANILKQDCLSIGADLVLPKDAITAKVKFVNCILIATDRELKILATKERLQPFGLKDLAKDFLKFITKQPKNIEIMGVLNSNNDSFYQGSRFEKSQTIYKIEQMIDDGADIIDIGAVSSRPGSIYIGEDEELKRLKPILKIIKENKLYKKVKFSLDTFSPKVIKASIKSNIEIINDITGLTDNKVAKLVSKNHQKIVIMHKKGDTSTMQNNPYYDNVILEVEEFFKRQIDKALSYKIPHSNIILDVGIGFGKRLEDNIELIKNLNHFQSLGYPLLIGASRKSMIDNIFNSKVEDRLSGTLAIHLEAIRNGASIIRVHDVYEHRQAIQVYKALNDY